MISLRNSFFIFTLFIFTGCTVKMQTNYLENGIVEYKDNVFGQVITIKQKDGYCLPNASFESSDVIIKLELSNDCRVLSAKEYTLNGKLLQTLPDSALNQLSNSITNYLAERNNMQAINEEVSK